MIVAAVSAGQWKRNKKEIIPPTKSINSERDMNEHCGRGKAAGGKDERSSW